MYSSANELEAFFHDLERADITDTSILSWRAKAGETLVELEQEFAAKQNSLRGVRARSTNKSVRPQATRALGWLLAAAFLSGMLSHVGVSAQEVTNGVLLENQSARNIQDPSAVGLPPPSLSQDQRRSILEDAMQLYRQGQQLPDLDSAVAKELFGKAASKYQLLVDSGIRNSRLYLNLGNAYLQSGDLGWAVVNYERARRLDPLNSQTLSNLEFARSKISAAGGGAGKQDDDIDTSWTERAVEKLVVTNEALIRLAGGRVIKLSWIVASLTFWGLMIARTVGWRFSVWRWAVLPLLLLIATSSSWMLAAYGGERSRLDGVFVTNQAELRLGDGEEFKTLTALADVLGQPVAVLSERGHWLQIRTHSGVVGWVPANHLGRL